MREIIKWIRRVNLLSRGDKQALVEWSSVGLSMFASRALPQSPEMQQVQKAIQQAGWEPAGSSSEQSFSVKDTPEGVEFREGHQSVTVPGSALKHSFLFKNQRQPPKQFVRSLVQLAFAVQNREPVLLVGPTSYKTLLVSTWVTLQGRAQELVKVHLTADSEASELVGQIQPYSLTDLAVSIPQLAAQLLARLKVIIHSSHLKPDDPVIQQQPFLLKMIAELQVDMQALVQAHISTVTATASTGSSLISQESSIAIPSTVRLRKSHPACLTL